MLPGPRLFRNRWMAVLWAAGILWVAIDIAQDNGGPSKTGPTVTTDATGTPVDDGDTSNAVAALESVKN
jgi:hypothetical protein